MTEPHLRFSRQEMLRPFTDLKYGLFDGSIVAAGMVITMLVSIATPFHARNSTDLGFAVLLAVLYTILAIGVSAGLRQRLPLTPENRPTAILLAGSTAAGILVLGLHSANSLSLAICVLTIASITAITVGRVGTAGFEWFMRVLEKRLYDAHSSGR